MSENAISIEILFEQYRRFCYLPGSSFDRDPSRDITKRIYPADPGMTPGMFTSLWLVTSVLSITFLETPEPYEWIVWTTGS
jgi:hypothetical protein